MQNALFHLYAYIRHVIRSLRSRKGYGVHAPFAFDFITHIINPENKSYFYCFESIERTFSSSIKSAKKCGELIFKTALYSKSNNIVEMGTGSGMETAYLALANKKAKVMSYCQETEIRKAALSKLDELHVQNVRWIDNQCKNIPRNILNAEEKIDLICFTSLLNERTTFQSFLHWSKTHAHKESVFIFCKIHHSPETYKIWRKIVAESEMKLSFECYNLGIVFCNPELQKQHFYV